MNALHFCFGVGTFITPVIIAQFVGRQGGMLWIYLLLAVLILPTAVVALLPSPASPHSAQQNAGSRTDPLLIILLSAVFGLYSGAGLAYSGWIFTYATNLNLTNATNAAYLTSIYWGGLTLGRLAAIPLAIRFSPRAVLRADFLGALLSLFIFLLWPRSITAIIIAAAGLGFSLASIYPTTMSLAGQLMTVSGKVTGLFSIGNSAGSMIVPWVVGQFFESAGPQSMILVLIVDVLLALGVLAMLARRSAPRVVVQGV
jgi:FHS family Na+ dependent glucose MFS transporter 1